MKALIYKRPGIVSLEERPVPTIIEPTDAIIKMTKTTICGTDLHILKGDVATCEPGRILGHEGVGIIDTVGTSVTNLKSGDRVLISCITADGKCDYCRIGMYSHCINGGWNLGNTIDGTQSEYVRIPYAETSLYKIPEGANEDDLVMLSDVLPTGFECGVLNGKIEPGNLVAIVGSGPIGLAVLLTVQFYSPAKIIMIDMDENRLEVAKRLGATHTINSINTNVRDKILEITNGIGVDTAVEAVGVPATFNICEDIIAPGGIIANIGVHGVKVDFHLERLWSQNITVTTRLVDTFNTPKLLKLVQAKKIEPKLLISHHFNFEDILEAYVNFEHAAETKAIKIIIDMK